MKKEIYGVEFSKIENNNEYNTRVLEELILNNFNIGYEKNILKDNIEVIEYFEKDILEEENILKKEGIIKILLENNKDKSFYLFNSSYRNKDKEIELFFFIKKGKLIKNKVVFFRGKKIILEDIDGVIPLNAFFILIINKNKKVLMKVKNLHDLPLKSYIKGEGAYFLKGKFEYINFLDKRGYNEKYEYLLNIGKEEELKEYISNYIEKLKSQKIKIFDNDKNIVELIKEDIECVLGKGEEPKYLKKDLKKMIKHIVLYNEDKEKIHFDGNYLIHFNSKDEINYK